MRQGGTRIVLSVLLFAAALAGCDSNGADEAGPTSREQVTVVSQNLLHGLACAPATDRCKLAARVELFARQLTEAECPQVVALQEVDPVMVGLLGDEVPKVCGGAYELVGTEDPSSDREVVLTTLPVLGQERSRLAGPLRTALWVRVGAALGPLDVVATHLASSSDDRPCDATTCAPPCRPDDSLNTCQGRQAADILEDHLTPESVGVLIGDLNATPGEPTIDALTSAGFEDTFLAAGNAECDSTTGVGCTGGRADQDLSDLADAASLQSERIDYVFLETARECSVAKSSGPFAAAPASPPLDDLVFASDHTGVQATISCATTARDRAAARPVAAGSSSTTTTRRASPVDAATRAAVTQAFETVFNGGTGADVETRLGALQDADELRDSFVARFEDPAIKPLAEQIRIRIDSMSGVGEDRVDVVYSLLLDQAVALDHLPGAAVREGGRWLVSRPTYCQVATLGASTVPEPCR